MNAEVVSYVFDDFASPPAGSAFRLHPSVELGARQRGLKLGGLIDVRNQPWRGLCSGSSEQLEERVDNAPH